jgi:hypothetical protein
MLKFTACVFSKIVIPELVYLAMTKGVGSMKYCPRRQLVKNEL